MKKSYPLENLCCANCAARIEQKLGRIEGVTSANINFLTGRMTYECEDARAEAVAAEAEKIVHKIEPDVTIVAL
jgi:copper chaperone CopZ